MIKLTGDAARVMLALALCATAAEAQGRGDTFLDARAKTLVTQARARKLVADRSIQEYQASTTERISFSFVSGTRDRLLYRRETAARIDWRRHDTIQIHVVGAREVVPVAVAGTHVPVDLKQYMPHVAFDPINTETFLRFDTTSIIHPLSKTGDDHYQFESGDSMSISLPNGMPIRIYELRFSPKRDDPHLIRGSFWIEGKTFSVVQAAFRYEPGRRDNRRRGDPTTFIAMTSDVSTVSITYGLYLGRWWMPSSFSMEGVYKFGGFGTTPLTFERTYANYEINGDTTGAFVTTDTVPPRQCRLPFQMRVDFNPPKDSVEAAERAAKRAAEREKRLARDPAARARLARMDSVRAAARDRFARADSIRAAAGLNVCNRQVEVTADPDSALLNSDQLPGSIYNGGTILSQADINRIRRTMSVLPHAGWLLHPPKLAFGFRDSSLIRFNRVEGLSIGARAGLDFGGAAASAIVRFGTADKQVSGEVNVAHDGIARSVRIGAYKRLAATDPALHPFSLTSSLGAAMFGQEDAQYFRAVGGEVVVTPAPGKLQWFALRLYGEKQSDVDVNTAFSVRHLFNKANLFNDNIAADAATQYGADATLRHDLGADPSRVRAGVELNARAETGTFEFVRPSITARAVAPLPAKLLIGVEGSSGTTFGDVPQQSEYYLGGTSSLRGYLGGVASGAAFWRRRVELARGIPLARLAIFSDAAWAGPRAEFSNGKPLVSAGIGLSFGDGLVRIDFARALRAPKDSRLHLYLNGLL